MNKIERAAGGLVLDTRGDVAVVSQCGTSWALPKGHLEPGEDALTAARREIHEETGLSSIRLLGHLGSFERSSIRRDGSFDEGARKTIDLFLFAAEGGPLTPLDTENPEARWVPRDIVPWLLSHPAERAAFRERVASLPPSAEDSNADAGLARRVKAILPDCPAEVLADFLALRTAPVPVIVARARRALDKPYGSNHLLIDEGQAGLSFAQLGPGQGTSYHVHELRTEVFLVRSGRLIVRGPHEDDVLEVGELGCSVPGRPHAVTNGGDEPLELLEIFSPAMLDDKLRLSDRYERRLGRVGVYD